MSQEMLLRLERLYEVQLADLGPLDELTYADATARAAEVAGTSPDTQES